MTSYNMLSRNISSPMRGNIEDEITRCERAAKQWEKVEGGKYSCISFITPSSKDLFHDKFTYLGPVYSITQKEFNSKEDLYHAWIRKDLDVVI